MERYAPVLALLGKVSFFKALRVLSPQKLFAQAQR
jgi:hypothetical protein